MGIDVILQGTTRQANKVLIEDIGEGDALLRCQTVIAPEHDDQAVNGEGTQLQVGGVDCGRKDANFRQSGRDSPHDLEALSFFKFDIDLWPRGHP